MTWLQFWLWVASFLISDYFRERLPGQTASGVGDFNIPTATEGRSVPIILGGTMRVDAPNCIWYGGFLADPKTITTGVIFKDEETIGYRYRLALQYALGKFESKGITGIWIGDDKVFDHVEDAAGVPQEVVDVTRYDLFGGNDSGGGFSGRFRLFNGADDQPVSDYLANVIGLDPLPAYRGLSYVMVTNCAETSFEGFQIIQSTPETLGAYIGDQNQLRYIRIEVQTFDTVANGGLGDRLALGNDHHFIGPDANPIAVAYELYLNDRWGRAFPFSDVSLTSFQAAAETCYTEGIGFSMLVDEQVSTGDLQDTLEQHVDGYIGPNPVTGQIEVTLSRPDYTLAAEFQATDDNIINVEKWNKGDWSQTYNRLRIRYSDRAKDWNETHAVQVSPGNRIIQGRTVTKELRYQGCHTASVAAVLAARGNRTLSLPQSSGTIVLDRTAWQMRPGSIMGLTSSQADETDLAVRITKIELGDGIGNSLKAEVVADISGNEVATVATPPATDFVPPIQQVIPFATADQAAFETPRLLMLADASPNAVPRVSTLARRASNNLPTEYEVIRRISSGTPSGAYTSTDVVAAGFSTVGELRAAAGESTAGNGTLSLSVDGIAGESLDGLIASYPRDAQNFAGVAVISPGEADEEWIQFDEIIDDGAGISLQNVYRGSMDTAWKPHDAGARVWFIWAGGLGMGDEVYPIGWNVEIKLLPTSPNDVVDEGDATALPLVAIDTNTAERNQKPLLPLTLSFGGSFFPTTVDFDGTMTVDGGTDEPGSEIVPTHKAWRTNDVYWSVRGFGVDGLALDPAVLTADDMRVSLWIHDLSQTPTTSRSTALASIIDQDAPDLTRTVEIWTLYLTRAALIAGGAEGFEFPARIEIETKHSPPGLAANNVSHDTLFFDFQATGIFSVLPDAALYQYNFDGADLDTEINALDPLFLPTLFVGDAAISTDQSVFGGSCLEFSGAGALVMVNRAVEREYFNAPYDLSTFDETGPFTIEFRIRWKTTTAQTFTVVGQWGNSGQRSWRLIWNQTRFEAKYSLDNSNQFDAINFPSTFSPVIDTWYAIRIVRNPPSFSRGRLFVDGVAQGGFVSWSGTPRKCGSDWTVGGLANAENYSAEGFDGFIDDLRIIPKLLSDPTAGASYTVNTEAFPHAGTLYPLRLAFEGTNGATSYTSDDLNKHPLTFTGTSAIDTAQSKFGSSSARFDGVNNFATPALQDGADVVSTVGLTDEAFSFKTGDFTIQGWFRINALPSTNPTENAGFCIIGKGHRATSGGFDWWVQLPANDNTLYFVRSPTGAISSSQGISGTIPTLTVDGVWRHFAVVREGVELSLYYEGNRVQNDATFFAASPKMWNNDSPSGGLNKVTVGYLGGLGSSSSIRKRAFNGWLDDIDVQKSALYSGTTYTVPTAPQPGPIDPQDLADNELLFLSNFASADGYNVDRFLPTDDLRGMPVLFGGNSEIDTGTPPPLSDYFWNFQMGNNTMYAYYDRSILTDLLDSDFTAEGWCRFTSAPTDDGGRCMFSHWASGDNKGWFFGVDDSNNLEFGWSADGTTANQKRAFASAGLTFATNTWYHIAVSRQGATLRFFLDGTLLTNDGASDSIGTDSIFRCPNVFRAGRRNDVATDKGGSWKLSELRIMRRAVYTTSFTRPTAAFPRPARPNLFPQTY